MRFGHFDDARREYVITRPDTPLPWLNYLGTEDYFALITNTAGGYSFYKDARLRRLTRYRYNNVPLDTGGRYLYVRDEESGDYWSPSWQPTQRKLDEYECRHGMSYTIIGARREGIRVQTRYFVPLGENLELWQMTIRNERKAPARLSVFSAVEFCLWDAWDDATNFQRNFSIGEVEVEDRVIYHRSEYRERRNHFAYFACSEQPAGFDTQREAFLGPYRGWERPEAVESGGACNSVAHGWQPIGSYHIPVSLQPGEEKQLIFLLGYFENRKDEKFDPADSQRINKRGVKPLIEKYTEKAAADHAFEALCKYWDRLLDILQVETPDHDVDRMVNIWTAYQCMITFNVSRSASLFESGIGRGLGFRDSNQDLLGFVQMVPARARQRILDLAATQLPSGGAYHQFQPLTRRGNHDIGGDFNDDPHWLVLAVGAYLRETADLNILSELVPYDNQPGSETPLHEHLQRAIQYTLERTGPHGLPLIGRADWNDCLNLNSHSERPGESFQTAAYKESGIAESIFIAALFVASTHEMSQIAAHYMKLLPGREAPFDVQEPEYFSDLSSEMERRVLEAGWDGDWFLRAYDAAGRKVGSKQCREGQLYIEPQGFCVLAGIGINNGYAQDALGAVSKQLASAHGLALLHPAYSAYDPDLGEISSYPPGYKENAGIFCHNNPWVMIAEARLGNGEAALDYYLRTNPSKREALADLHRCEPYVYAQMIAGPDAPTHGEAKNSWLTGAAAWNYVAITQWILGIRPEYEGLRIDPCIPADWQGFKVTRTFRGQTLHITVHNPRGVGRGVARMSVDGEDVPGNLLAPGPAGAVRQVEVWMG
jgi:cellobiose phosphorylase